MPRALSIQEFDYKSLEEKLRYVEAFLDRTQPVRVNGCRASGSCQSIKFLRGRTAILPSHWDSHLVWEPRTARGRLEQLDWFEKNYHRFRDSPLDFGIRLVVEEGVFVWAGDFWVDDGFALCLIVEGFTGEEESLDGLLRVVENNVSARGVKVGRVVSRQYAHRFVFKCSTEEMKAVAVRMDEGRFAVPEDRHFLAVSTGGRDLLEGKNPVEVAKGYSAVSQDRCEGPSDYALGVVFDLAVQLGSELDCPEGLWQYSASFLDSGAVAECGVDRFETVLFDQPEARTVGVLSTSFGDIQLNSIYADGKYRLELESKYPLDELPKELADWGVEFDLK